MRGFDKKFTFAAISSLLRVVWPQFFYWRTPWMSRSVLNTYTKGFRCDFAPTQPFKVPRLSKNSSKSQSWASAKFHEKSKWNHIRVYLPILCMFTCVTNVLWDLKLYRFCFECLYQLLQWENCIDNNISRVKNIENSCQMKANALL